MRWRHDEKWHFSVRGSGKFLVFPTTFWGSRHFQLAVYTVFGDDAYFQFEIVLSLYSDLYSWLWTSEGVPGQDVSVVGSDYEVEGPKSELQRPKIGNTNTHIKNTS